MNWKHAGIGAVAVVPVLAMLAYGLTRDPREIRSPLPGKTAPTFALATLQRGDSVRLNALKGDVVVLNFWASWCLACRDEHEALIKSAQLYLPRGVHFYGVLYNDTRDNGAKY